ncbi:hypothetical protein [Glaciecola sp. 1036]|uniref:hypothetical protein n=1 Tax=Alteromonadaceae TaxID=72275 RepID=UPI003CFEDAEE
MNALIIKVVISFIVGVQWGMVIFAVLGGVRISNSTKVTAFFVILILLTAVNYFLFRQLKRIGGLNDKA